MDFLSPYGAIPNERQMVHYRMEKKAMFCFGPNTFTNREWGDGTEDEAIFNPVGCDCRQWIRAIKSAGFELAILTAKHHDGFCLWPSQVTEHSVKNSPYKEGKGDIVREFTDACHEFGVKVGIYLSPWDRNASCWGKPEYNQFYALQLTELLTGYGPVDEIWWDGAGSRDMVYDWGLWAYTVRTLQPNAAIFGCMGATPFVDLRWVGNESGYAGNPCFATIDTENMLSSLDLDVLNHGVADAELFVPAEADVSIRPGWYYHAEQDGEIKTVREIIRVWMDSVGSNCNMLLSFPPDKNGLLRPDDIKNAIDAHQIIAQARSWNYALNADISCDIPCHEGYEAENMLIPEEHSFFAPQGTRAVVTMKLQKKARVNMFEIAEVIELGHRVRGFTLEALVVDEWKTLFKGNCIGYKWADHFAPVETDTVRLTISDAKDVPLLRFFALYHLDESIFSASDKISAGCVDLTKGPSARVNCEEKSVEVEFGGIYPFNTVAFNGNDMSACTIEAFDGAGYQPVCRVNTPHREEVVSLPETIRYAYKMRVVFDYSPVNPDTIAIAVYEV